MKRPTVIIRKCPDYDVDRIAKIVTEGLIELDLRPHGKTLVKPNCVASGPLFPHAHTRPEFLEGVLQALKERADERTEEISLGERSGITIPTRFGFNEAKYPAMMKRVGGVRPYYFDEVRQVQKDARVPRFAVGKQRDVLPVGLLGTLRILQVSQRKIADGPQRLDLPLVVTIEDNGEGIRDDLRPHLFDPFVTTKVGGNGLGLALVAKLIGDHGGVVEFEGEARRTRFHVRLPVVSKEGAE